MQKYAVLSANCVNSLKNATCRITDERQCFTTSNANIYIDTQNTENASQKNNYSHISSKHIKCIKFQKKFFGLSLWETHRYVALRPLLFINPEIKNVKKGFSKVIVPTIHFSSDLFTGYHMEPFVIVPLRYCKRPLRRTSQKNLNP